MNKLFIGATQAEFNGDVNVAYQVFDIKSPKSGNNNVSYTIELPLTPTNKKLLAFSNIINAKAEVTETARLFIKDILAIAGKVVVLGINKDTCSMLITADDYLASLVSIKLRDVDFSSRNHVFTSANVVSSWTASNNFYRYGMVNYGQIFSKEIGSTANWVPNDFVPSFRVVDILDDIIYPWSINSNVKASVLFQKLYVHGSGPINETDFIANKGLEIKVNSIADNSVSKTITTGTTDTLTLTKDFVDLDTIVLNEGNHWGVINDKYTVPTTGTYRFKGNMDVVSDIVPPSFSSISYSYSFYIIKNDGISDTTLATFTGSGSGPVPASTAFDAGWLHLEEDDEIRLKVVISTTGYNETITDTYSLQLDTTTTLELTWDDRNLHAGVNKTINAADYLPDITVAQFIQGIKEMANLKIFVDRTNQTLYIEDGDSFTSNNVIDITDNIDYSEEIKQELISSNYSKSILLKWKEDKSDKAYAEYKQASGEPNVKTISLASVYATAGETVITNSVFANTAVGYMIQNNVYVDIPRIYGSSEYLAGKVYPEYRATSWQPRLFTWEGLTSGVSWVYEKAVKTTYPKLSVIDMADMFLSYFIKSYHYIDKGKIITLTALIKPTVIAQFNTVVSDNTKEGFMVTYKATINNQDLYFILNNITTDGDRAELELILKI